MMGGGGERGHLAPGPGDPLTGLDEVDWASLRRGPESVGPIPELLRDLASGRSAAVGSALGRLEYAICHDGTVYEATAPSVPFLRAVAAVPGGPRREEILVLLREIACGEGPGDQRSRRYFVATPPPEELAAERRAAIDARDAVAAGVEEYLAALEDPTPRVRAAAAYLLAALPEQAGRSIDPLLARLPVEEDRVARIGAVLAAGELAAAVLGPSAEATEAVPGELGPDSRMSQVAPATGARAAAARVPEALVQALGSTDTGTRTAAAIALGRQSWAGPISAPVMSLVAASLDKNVPGLDRTPWRGSGVHEIIVRGVGTDLTGSVAAIREELSAKQIRRREAAVSWGSLLLYRWRDTAPSVLPVLAPALADTAPSVRARTAAVLADNAAGLLAPAADALVAALDAAQERFDLDRVPATPPSPRPHDPEVGLVGAALTCLGRLGDVRCLDPLLRVARSGAVMPDWRRVLGGMVDHVDVLVPVIEGYLWTAPPLPPARSVNDDPRLSGTLRALAGWGPRAAALVPVLLDLLTRIDRNECLIEALVAATSPEHPLASQVVDRLGEVLETCREDPWCATYVVAYWRSGGDTGTALDVLRAQGESGSGGWHKFFEALAEFGPLAEAFLPRVRGGLAARWAHERVAAAHAYWRITGDPGPALPVLLAELEIASLGPVVMRHLGEIGAPAAEAVPFLRAWRDRCRRILLGGRVTTVDQDEEFRGAADVALAGILGG